MLYLREHKTVPSRLSDLLPWAAFVSKGIILNKDGSLQTTIRYRGPDLDSVGEAELSVTAHQLNNLFRRFGSSYALFFESKRTFSSPYPISIFPDEISALVDEHRRAHYENDHHFESSYYLTLCYLPPEDLNSRFTKHFLTSSSGASSALEQFEAEVLRALELLQSIFPECEILSPEETLTYLHGTISSKEQSIQLPEIPMYLDSLLADEPLIGGLSPKLGNKHLAIIGLLGYPGSTQAGLLDALNTLPFCYRWSTRFLPLDKSEAKKELEGFQRKWFAKRKGMGALIRELLTKEESALSDSEALEKAKDSQEAVEELGTDEISYGYYTTAIVLASEDPNELRSQASAVERVINGAGFVTRVETFNSVDAWLGTIPGNTRNNVRKPLLSSLNLSHLLPGSSALWSGEPVNAHLEGPPLAITETRGSTPFRLNLHVGDVGHTLILGPTGSGKSTLVNFLALSFLRYEDAQVYICDKGRSSFGLTLSLQGDHYELGTSELSFQPLRNVDDEYERRWAHEWLLGILQHEGVIVSPKQKKHLWETLESIASSPLHQRTLSALTIFLQDQALRDALLPFTKKGAHGHTLDASEENLLGAHFQCFEMEELMDTPSLLAPALSYLFHRLEARFTGRPTLLILDEAWLYLDHPLFSAKIREWLKTLRKKNVSVVFSTQSLSDVEQSEISSSIKESCFTRIFLPNPQALNQEGFYSKFGLNETQREIISYASPKKDYYYSSTLGERIFSLALDELTLKLVAGASEERTKLIREIRDSTSKDTFSEKFLSSLLPSNNKKNHLRRVA